jgi:RNA polymerase primary sigma factor
VSLDRAVFDEDEDTTLLKRLADGEQESPDECITRSSSQKQLERVLDGLDEREHEIIQLYFGLEGAEPMTLEQIGDRMSLTRERIRQLKERAFGKLRHPSRHEELRSLED